MPKKTLDLIISLGGHFLVQVKTNCPKLWQSLFVQTLTQKPLSAYEYGEKGHGRQVYRRVEVYGPLLQPVVGWNGIQRVIKVHRWGQRQGKLFEQTAYYILSKPMNSAQKIAQAIQSHWSIENKLHWAKDVNLREDFTPLTKHGHIAMLVLLNNMAINILNQNGYKSVKNTFAKFANKVKELITLFPAKT